MSGPRSPQAPAVSVIMAVLNPHPQFFPEAVRSILRQTLEDWELIIVEDPSSVSGKMLLTGLEDGRIRHCINPQRTSLVEQRNQALAEARAPFVAIMDADDLAEPARLEKQVNYLTVHPEVGILGSQICVIDAEGTQLRYRSFPGDHDAIVRAMRTIVPLSQPSTMYRRNVVVEGGGYRYGAYETAEDYELWSRLVQRGVRFANHPEALLRYRCHPGQMKATHLHRTIRGVLQVKEQYWRGKMNFREKARMWGERALLWLPAWLVMKLLMQAQYRDASPRNLPACGRICPAFAKVENAPRQVVATP